MAFSALRTTSCPRPSVARQRISRFISASAARQHAAALAWLSSASAKLALLSPSKRSHLSSCPHSNASADASSSARPCSSRSPCRCRSSSHTNRHNTMTRSRGHSFRIAQHPRAPPASSPPPPPPPPPSPSAPPACRPKMRCSQVQSASLVPCRQGAPAPSSPCAPTRAPHAPRVTPLESESSGSCE